MGAGTLIIGTPSCPGIPETGVTFLALVALLAVVVSSAIVGFMGLSSTCQ